MEWSSSVSGNLVAADDFDDDNPWTPNRSIASTSVGRPPSEHTIRDNDHPNGEADLQDNLLTNPLYQRSPELNDTAGSSKLTNQQSTNGQHLHTDATRPSLYRVTSNSLNGLLHGLDTLAFSNTVQESLSTENADPKGARRSLEELRRFTIKGKGQPVDLQTDDTVWDDNVYQSRRPSRPRGREALLHLVQKGDSLAGIALLYGCTVQSVRTANKLWLNDPIYLRKTLYIPLDACTQPPSREVEFVQRSGEDHLEMYFRSVASSSKGSAALIAPHPQPPLRMRSASLRQEALYEEGIMPYKDTSPHSSTAHSPFSSQRSSFSQTSQSRSFSNMPHQRIHSSSSQYSDVSESPSQDTTTSRENGRINLISDTRVPNSRSASVRSDSPENVNTKAEQVDTKRTIQIVEIPGTNVHKVSPTKSNLSRTRGNSPLVPVDSLLDRESPITGLPPANEALIAVSSAALLTPSSSNEHLSAVSGQSMNRRLRPRSPRPGMTTFPAGSGESGSLEQTLSPNAPGMSRSGSNDGLQIPARRRKISKEAVPKSASPTFANPSFPSFPKTVNTYISAGAGLVSSFIGGGSSGSGRRWLATDDFEEEMQLARDYQSRQHRRASSQSVHARSKSASNAGPSDSGPATRRLGKASQQDTYFPP